MRWFDVDGARDHLTDAHRRHACPNDHESAKACLTCGRPSRKTLYGMVHAGLKVAPRGESGARFWFCAEWIDAFLEQRAGNRALMFQKKGAA